MEEIQITYLVDYAASQLLVKLEIGAQTKMLTTDQARDLGGALLENASNAESDLVMMRFLRHAGQVPREQIEPVLELFRQLRNA